MSVGTVDLKPVYQYRAKCSRIIDGDTYYLAIDLGFNVSTTISCRLHGVDAPERDTPEGQKAKEFVGGILFPLVMGLHTATPLIVVSYKDRQSFARWVCDVFYETKDGWTSLAQTLLDNNQAVPMER
jgi:micrococcal nuclease